MLQLKYDVKIADGRWIKVHWIYMDYIWRLSANHFIKWGSSLPSSWLQITSSPSTWGIWICDQQAWNVCQRLSLSMPGILTQLAWSRVCLTTTSIINFNTRGPNTFDHCCTTIRDTNELMNLGALFLTCTLDNLPIWVYCIFPNIQTE